VQRKTSLPTISVVLAAHNEAGVLPEKLKNVFATDYPANLLEVVVVSDGSTDGTEEILQNVPDKRLHPIFLSERQGKAAALNQGIAAARGEVIIFTDARQEIEREAIPQLIASLGDREVGCVSGELCLNPGDGSRSTEGVGLYWKMEKQIRKLESLSGSVVGATGALYAVRRELVPALPVGTILDDVYIPMDVVRQGYRVVFEPEARAWDGPTAGFRREFLRKVRTLTGNYQLLQLMPWLLKRTNPLRFELVSHKLLRLFVPFTLVGLLASSAYLPGDFYRACLAGQLLFYGISPLGALRPRVPGIGRLANVALSFVVLNTAALVALVHFLTGKREVWVR
jgi:cellulose synthase/poly-beta-1,6-N-acetylglucosamine synthase-like glycosyltransferase